METIDATTHVRSGKALQPVKNRYSASARAAASYLSLLSQSHSSLAACLWQGVGTSLSGPMHDTERSHAQPLHRAQALASPALLHSNDVALAPPRLSIVQSTLVAAVAYVQHTASGSHSKQRPAERPRPTITCTQQLRLGGLGWTYTLRSVQMRPGLSQAVS